MAGQVADSRELMSRVRGLGQAQRHRGRAAREGARGQIDGVLTAWARIHGLTAPGEAQRREDVAPLLLAGARTVFGNDPSISVTTVEQLRGTRRVQASVVATGTARAVDELQDRLSEGPGVEALELDMLGFVRADDLSRAPDATSWPRLSEAATALGVRSVLSIAVPWSAFRSGLHPEHHPVGAVNLYASEPLVLAQPESQTIMFGSWVGSISGGKVPSDVYVGE